MFWPDVIDLKTFYSTRMGGMAQQFILRKIREFWAPSASDGLLGVGYALPFLPALTEKNGSVILCMPAQQGVIHWPEIEKNLAFLSDECELPLRDNSLNRVLVVHAFEHCEQLRRMLQEIWRTLTPGGRVLIVVPNRRGVWARRAISPFAHGHTFTTWQLRHLLYENKFTPLASSTALFFPPTESRLILRAAPFLEKLGKYIFSGLGGVLLMEAEKQIYAPLKARTVRNTRRAYVPVGKPAITTRG